MASKEKNTEQTNAPKAATPAAKPVETSTASQVVTPESTEQPAQTATISEQPNAGTVETNTASQTVQNHSATTQAVPKSTEQPAQTATISEQPNAGTVEANTASQTVQNHSATTQAVPKSTEQPKPTDTESTEQPSEQQEEAVAKLFKLYPHVQEFHVTADATAFFNENDAKNHARTLKDISVVNIKR